MAFVASSASTRRILHPRSRDLFQTLPLQVLLPLRGDPTSSSGTRSVKNNRKLSIVLKTSVENVGRAGQVAQVAPGYFRNKLLPQKLALPAIPKYLKLVEEFRKAAVEKVPVEKAPTELQGGQQENLIAEAEKAARLLEKRLLSVRRRTEPKSETLKKPVTRADIVKEVYRQMNIHLADAHVTMPTELVSLGEFEIPLKFPSVVKLPSEKEIINLRVKVRRP